MVIAVHVVHLRRIEEKQDEKVAAAEEGDEKDEDHCSSGLPEKGSRHHGVFCDANFVDEKLDDEHDTNHKWYQDVDATPGVLNYR